MTVKMEKHTARKYSSPIRERQANQTRTNILDATQRLFLERGYAKTTVEAIGSRSGGRQADRLCRLPLQKRHRGRIAGPGRLHGAGV